MQLRSFVIKGFILLLGFFMALPFSTWIANAESNQGYVAGSRNDIRSLKRQLKELQMKIEQLENQNQIFNQKLYDAVNTDKPMKDSWVDKIKIKTKKGLTFQTKDKNYKMRMRLRGQFLANYVDPEGDDNEGFGFRVRRLRLYLDGNAFAPWMKYKFQYDFSRDGELKDLKFIFAKNKMFVPMVGQYKVPFNRGALNSSSALQMVGHSIVTDYFEYGRDIGGGVYGLLADGRIRYEVGVFQGEGANVGTDNDDIGVLLAGRIQAAVFGDDAKKVKENFAKEPTLIFGIAAAGIDVDSNENKSENNIGIPEGERTLTGGGRVTSVTADINYRHADLFNLTGEYIGRWLNSDVDNTDTAYDYGFRVQGGLFLVPKKFEIASRYAMVVFDDDVSSESEDLLDNVWAFNQSFNYYLSGNHKWKLQVDYTYQREENTDGVRENENLVRAQVQAYF